MPVDLHPPVPYVATLTAQQASDLACARGGMTLASAASPPSKAPLQTPWTRPYLVRLERSDPTRDWARLITPLSGDMRYGDFMALMNGCADAAKRDKKAR